MSEQNPTTIDDDWLLHVLWDHYPERLPCWEETPLHIREGLAEMARKVREAVRDGRKL